MKLQLDYKIKNIDERMNIVEKICEEHQDELTNYNLEQLANYLIYQIGREERKKREILTPNRMVTVNKRETSFEGLTDKFEKNKDGVYNLMNEDKNTILSPKISITEQDIKDIPYLKKIRKSIEDLKELPNRNYIIQQAIIQLSQSQYTIKRGHRQPMSAQTPHHQPPPNSTGIDWGERMDFKKWERVAAFLQHYEKLKIECTGDFENDVFWMIQEFEELAESALKIKEPKLYDIMFLKVKGLQNKEVRKTILNKYGSTYSMEYISSLFNNKIPKLIAEEARTQELIYNFTFNEKGNWKKCNRCGEVKLLHSKFFSKNSNNSRDGFYSICKECRNKK